MEPTSAPNPQPRRRPRRLSTEARLARISAVVASLVFVTFVTVSASRAAFSATTTNTSNTATAAGLTLTDDDSASALFTLTDMTPGNTFTRCIALTYTGATNLTQPVTLYRNAAPTGTGLEQYLDLTIDIGTGGNNTSCTGFTSTSQIYTGTLATFLTNRTSYANGLNTTWTPSATPQTRTYRFTLAVQDNNAAQALTTGFGFTWEARS